MHVFQLKLLLVLQILHISTPAYFNTEKSTSLITFPQQFELSYLDGSDIKGKICRDIVKIGNIILYANFGCIHSDYKKNSAIKDSAGILGLGFPIPSEVNNYLEQTNFFYALSHDNDTMTIPKVFTLIIDKFSEYGELQIGGVDLSRVNVNRKQEIKTNIIIDCNEDNSNGSNEKICKYKYYRIAIDTVRLGNKVLYSRDSSADPLSAIIDSGTTCLILPTRVGSERIYTDMYALFMDEIHAITQTLMTSTEDDDVILTSMPSLFIRIENQEIEIPYSSYIISLSPMSEEENKQHRKSQQQSNKLKHPLCILTIPTVPSLFLLGDVFMQNAVVIHNLTNANQPYLRILPKNNIKTETVTNDINIKSESSLLDYVNNTPHDFMQEKKSINSYIDYDSVDNEIWSSSSSDAIIIPIQKKIINVTSEGIVSKYEEVENSTIFWNNTYYKNRNNYDIAIDKDTVSISNDSEIRKLSLLSVVRLEELRGIQYTANIQVGSPLQRNISVIVDCGSGATALYDSSYSSNDHSGIMNQWKNYINSHYSTIITILYNVFRTVSILITVLLVYALYNIFIKYTISRSNVMTNDKNMTSFKYHRLETDYNDGDMNVDDQRRSISNFEIEMSDA